MEKYHKREYKDVLEFFEKEKAAKKQTPMASKQLSLESVMQQGYSSKLNKRLKPCIFTFTEDSIRRAAIDKALTNMIVTDLQPVSMVEDAGFKNFLKVLDSKYTAPSRRTIMREHLPHLYETKKKGLMDKLSNVKWCSITTDLWTARTTMGYITVTCHFITPDWTMESAVLETSHVPESHTIINLAAELKKITDEWKITSKIHCAITDGASNIKGAIRQNHWNNLVCFAHTLNLVVTGAISQDPEANEVIEKVKHIVTFFHKSTLASGKLHAIQARLDLPDHSLIQQVETRWNSTFYMMERYIEQCEAIRTTLCIQDRNDLVLSSEKNPFID